MNRFWNKVDKSGNCWLWTASKTPQGYGHFNIDGFMHKAHRVSYRLTFGDVIGKLHVLHRCDNPSCVNPSHLFLGTNDDNIADRVRKNRSNGAAGVDNGNSKLTRVAVKQIRASLKNKESPSRLAKLYKVHRSTIHRIGTNCTWNFDEEDK